MNRHALNHLLIRFYILIIAAILGLATAVAQSTPQRNLDSFYRENSSRSINDLSLSGYRALTRDIPDPENALAYFTLAAGKYDPSLPELQQHNAVVSMSNIGYIYLFYYHNPELAYPWLSKAENIAINGPKFVKRVLPSIYDNFAKIYDDYGDTLHSLHLYKKSYNLAISYKDRSITTLILNDAVNLAFHSEMLDSIAPELQHFSTFEFPDSLPLARYSKLLSKGLLLMLDKRYDESYEILSKATSLINSRTDNWRFIANHYRYLSGIAMARNDVGTALRKLREAKCIAVREKLDDMVPKLYLEISSTFDKAGMQDSAAIYKLRALETRDSLFTTTSFGRIKDFEASDTLNDMQETMKKADASHRKRLSFLFIALAAILVAIVFIVIIVNRNRKLAASNRALVRQNMEALRAQEVDRQMIKEFEEKLAACGSSVPEPEGESEETTEGPGRHRRLASIPLDDDAVLRLAASVKQIMATSKEILSPDFSLENLSEMTGTKPTYLSNIINVVLKKNFSQLLAEARIAEACRRMLDDKNYATRSLDAIAEDVGYRSRSYFSTVFKKVTGLTPAKYLQIASDPNFDKDSINH